MREYPGRKAYVPTFAMPDGGSMWGYDEHAIGICTSLGRMAFVRLVRPENIPNRAWEELASGFCKIMNDTL